jgi:hypothetical protein
MTMRSRVAEKLLGFLERREERLLAWGFYDATFDFQSVDRALQDEGGTELQNLWAALVEKGENLETMLSDMAYGGLLHEVESGRYRTRFAEGVRLIARLRQRFKAGDWATAPNLVSDIKVHLAPRRYPRRDQSAAQCWKDLEPKCSRVALQRDVFFALATGSNGEQVRFSGFQRRAFAHLLERYGAQDFRGSVVSAGTGAGKTKAFYVPAFVALAADVASRPERFPRIIAIYPRNVLLADQLREALAEAAKFQSALEQHGVRRITFGALLGDTPWEGQLRSKTPSTSLKNWKRTGNGWVVPFVKSPIVPDDALVWRDADRARGSTALYREGSTTPDIRDGTLLLTRDQLQQSPPDVLFLSLEMLNREMGNPEWWKAFGIQGAGEQVPRMLLLDEVHSYSGLPGAQAAWVLRRWQHWTRARQMHVVGLSATLRSACQHLGLVSGLSPQAIRELTPDPSELEAEGMEYNLAVKGDPASATSLLATSIQCGMLLSRLQTPPRASGPIDGDSIQGSRHYARRVFGFSDNLDTLNRWLADSVDAERQRLAQLRLPPSMRTPPEEVPPETVHRMREAGQVWDLPVALGYDLSQSLRVSRCSSQDPGVDSASDLIIATASLEVGYDDPEVAATLHHKRPRSLSSFIQRKGRAGRRRGTRPWTVTILSDYGSDKWAFQNAEQLFEPQVDAQHLPVTNPYVLRIQATAFLVDWLGRTVKSGSPYRFLGRRDSSLRSAQLKAIDILRDILILGPHWLRFRRDLAHAFRYPRGRGSEPMDEAALDAILWEEPRPVLPRAIPTLLRKLEADWSFDGRTGEFEDAGLKRPLPGYLPAATFDDLDVSEMRLHFPASLSIRKEPQALALGHGLMEACPGNVSKRFSYQKSEPGYWHTHSSRILSGAPEGSVQELFPDAILLEVVDGISVYQAQRANLEQVPTTVKPSSKSAWRWKSRLRSIAQGHRLPVLGASPWADLVDSCEAHLHRDRSSVEVLRYAQSATFELVRAKQDPLEGTFELQSRQLDNRSVIPQAVGFRQRVDGLIVRLKGGRIGAQPPLEGEVLARLRPQFLLHLFQEELGVNVFLAEWLFQVSLSVLTATALTKRCSLGEAQARLAGMREGAAAKVLDSILNVADIQEGTVAKEGRLRSRILAAWRDPTILKRIEELERVLWDPPSEAFMVWARRRAVATVAQALRVAVVSRVTDLDEDDVELDVQWREDGGADVFITERHSGGLGQIEQAVQSLSADPDLFHDALRHALQFCPREALAKVLLQANEASIDPLRPLTHAFETVRRARDISETESAKIALRGALNSVGLPPTRSTTVSIVNRLLRPASSPRTDVMLCLLNRGLRRAGRRLGVDVDHRVFAYLCMNIPSAQRRLNLVFRELGEGRAPQPHQAHALIQQMLISSCKDSCKECLDTPNRFSPFGRPSRDWARLWLKTSLSEIRVDVNQGEWTAQALAILAAKNEVGLRVVPERIADVSESIHRLLAHEMEVGHLLVPIVLTQVERDSEAWILTLRLQEVVRGHP